MIPTHDSKSLSKTLCSQAMTLIMCDEADVQSRTVCVIPHHVQYKSPANTCSSQPLSTTPASMLSISDYKAAKARKDEEDRKEKESSQIREGIEELVKARINKGQCRFKSTNIRFITQKAVEELATKENIRLFMYNSEPTRSWPPKDIDGIVKRVYEEAQKMFVIAALHDCAHLLYDLVEVQDAGDFIVPFEQRHIQQSEPFKSDGRLDKFLGDLKMVCTPLFKNGNWHYRNGIFNESLPVTEISYN